MARPVIDVEISANAPQEMLLEKHADYIHAYESKKDDYEYVMTEFLRMNGIYWGLTAMSLMRQLDRMNKDEILEFVRKCQNEDGGVAHSLNYDSHMLSTLSAVQIACLFDRKDVLDVDGIVKFIMSLHQPDGSFFGDKWGEVDTRFSFCAVAALSLLGRLDVLDRRKVVDFILRCMNVDGGFGTRPESETHSGQIYCCVGTLSILDELHHVDADQLGWWLAERQLPSGGLNGRPEKMPDLCYSWWVLSSLRIIGRLHWVDVTKLTKFILACQDDESGGFADRPGDLPDPFHTLFGLAGLSLMEAFPGTLDSVNPVYCMPQRVIKHLGSPYRLINC